MSLYFSMIIYPWWSLLQKIIDTQFCYGSSENVYNTDYHFEQILSHFANHWEAYVLLVTKKIH